MNFEFMRSLRLSYLLCSVIQSWLLFILFRIVFYYTFSDSVFNVGSFDLARAFWVGIRFDLRLSFIISLPLNI